MSHNSQEIFGCYWKHNIRIAKLKSLIFILSSPYPQPDNLRNTNSIYMSSNHLNNIIFSATKIILKPLMSHMHFTLIIGLQ